MMGRLGVGLFLAVVLGALAAPARAEPVLELGPGSRAVTAVTDAAGTLHAVWRYRCPLTVPCTTAACLLVAEGARRSRSRMAR